jgi:hypothetical protein
LSGNKKKILQNFQVKINLKNLLVTTNGDSHGTPLKLNFILVKHFGEREKTESKTFGTTSYFFWEIWENLGKFGNIWEHLGKFGNT